MKTSNKAMLGTVSAIVGLIFIGAVAARMWVCAITGDTVQIPDPGPAAETRPAPGK
jgi:hypothetical protein